MLKSKKRWEDLEEEEEGEEVADSEGEEEAQEDLEVDEVEVEEDGLTLEVDIKTMVTMSPR